MKGDPSRTRKLIMKISGHKSLKDFYKYIKIAPEQAGERIKEIWKNRGEINIENQQIEFKKEKV